MKNNIKNIAVIGTGVIGAGWIIRSLAHNQKLETLTGWFGQLMEI